MIKEYAIRCKVVREVGTEKEVEYYGETYKIPESVFEQIVTKGERTQYNGQCEHCQVFNITQTEKEQDHDLWAWCIRKCWSCTNVYKNSMLDGIKGMYENKLEEKDSEIERLKGQIAGKEKEDAEDKREEKKSVKGTYIRRKPALERCWPWFERERKEDRHYSNKYIGSRTETEEHRVSEARRRYISIVKDVTEEMGIEELSKKWHIGSNLAKRMSKAIKKTTKKVKEKM